MRLSDAQRTDWLRLIRCEGVGPRSFRGLVNRFGGAAAALESLPSLAKARGRPLVAPSKAQAEAEIAAGLRLGVRLVATGEPDYPEALAAIDSAPPLIGLRGEAAAACAPSVAVVGSRNASAAGLAFTARLVQGFGEAGLVVVSGLARGVDARAHRAALGTGTVAVLAGGHDRIYPASHAGLVDEILAEGGALIAEMPMGWEPRGRDFPRRNRLISGLALGTVVVEAARRSGSLITARYANEQGREVFSVPGSPLDPRSEGTNDLIRQGATLVSEADHVIAALAPLIEAGARRFPPAPPPRDDAPAFWDEIDLDGTGTPPAPPPPELGDLPEPAEDDERGRLLAALGPAPVGTDDLARATGLPVRVVQTLLLELELDGLLERQAGGGVSLIR